jgi:hypothetical protein
LRNECCTTEDVYRETVITGLQGSSLIAEAFEKWLMIKSVDRNAALELAEKEGIEAADATLILLAEEVHGTLLTNDKALINLARSRSIPWLWLTSFLLTLCNNGRINKEEALRILFDLVQAGLRVEAKIYAILEKRLKSIE